MSDWPHDAASFLARFADREPRDALEKIAERWGADLWSGSEFTRPHNWGALAALMYDRQILSGRFGWIDPEGVWRSCGHAGHELLLELLGLEVREIEQTWVRVSMATIHATMDGPNDAQAATLLRLFNEGVLMPGAMKAAARVWGWEGAPC